MFSLNRMTAFGNLGDDPEIRTFQSGDRIAKFSVGTNDSYKDRETGEYVKTVEWHSVVVRKESLIKQIEKHLKKGSSVYVEGKLQKRSYQDNKHPDVKHYITEIVIGGNNGKVLFEYPDVDPGERQYHDG